MKKLISIAFLAVFLLNLGGYYGVFWLLRVQANRELQKQLDANNYHESEAITLMIPVTLPYQTNSTSYERVKGEFEFKGEYYKLVKQKLENDTLKIVCIKDYKEKQLVTSMIDFTKINNDLPATSTTIKVLGSFLKEFNAAQNLRITNQERWSKKILFSDPVYLLSSPILSIASPPPKSFC